MLRTVGTGVLLLGVIVAGGMAGMETAFVLAGGGTLDLWGTGGLWLACGVCWALMWVVARRAALMVACGVAATTAIGVLSFWSALKLPTAFMFFGALALGVAASTAVALVRAERRAARQPNPLKDIATELSEDPPILETGGIQYLATLDTQESPPALKVRVLLQNCQDTPATARVRLEEDAVGEPGVLLPEVESVEIGAEGWSVLDWTCPVRQDHRGEGWFHLSLKVQRDRNGRRTRLWRAETGPSGFKATQLLHGLAPRQSQYSGVTVVLPKVDEELARAHCSARAVEPAELESLLREIA